MTSQLGDHSAGHRPDPYVIDRRAFVRAAVAVLAAARTVSAQQSGKMWRVGWVRGGGALSAATDAIDAAFRKGLGDVGYVEGQNLVIDARYAEARFERFPAIIGEVLALKPDVIVIGGPQAIRAAQAATATIPIVVIDLESEPVASGLIKSLPRPGGNITGVFLDLPELAGKQLQFLQETLPGMKRVAVLSDPSVNQAQLEATEAAARAAGITVQSLPVQRLEDIETAIVRAGRERVKALSVLTSPLIFVHQKRIAELALKYRLASMSIFSMFPDAGGLMAYGPDFPAMYRRLGTYVDRIFKGASPAELPIERPTRFELVINLKTAKTLGLTMPKALLIRSDRVIR